MKQSKSARFVVAVNTGDDTLSPFDDIQTASAELGRALRLRWSASFRAERTQSVDVVEARRDSIR
jgi:hypothetical protein